MKVTQRVFEAKWVVAGQEGTIGIVQLFCAKDFKGAFFKARNWAKENAAGGDLISFVRRDDMVI